MRCDVCGNEDGKSFEVVAGARTMTFDAFECAIQALAPRCGHCECMIAGRGVEAAGVIYCSAECARQHDGAELHEYA